MAIAVSTFAWVGRGGVVFVALSVLLGVVAGLRAQTSAVLFPQPLHLVRRIDDPLAGGAVTVDQYCAGNRIVTVRGERVSIADYSRQELTEIDRAAGTYSVTPFAAIAKTAAPARKSDDVADAVKVRVAVSDRITVSRAALEVLIGAAYPNPRRAQHDAIVAAIRGKGGERFRASGNSNAKATTAAEYALPTEQVTTFDTGGESVTISESVLHVANDLVRPELLLIPPGATRVDSPRIRAARELRALDELPPQRQ